MKTRTQLLKEGILLEGPIVPDWFRLQSDACSTPGGRLGGWLLKRQTAQAACYIHDFEYYLTALQWPSYSPAWMGDRLKADANLKVNRRKMGRNKLVGWIYSRIYFRGTRIGGRWSMKNPQKRPLQDRLAVPPGPKSREQLKKYLNRPLPSLAEQQFIQWERREHR